MNINLNHGRCNLTWKKGNVLYSHYAVFASIVLHPPYLCIQLKETPPPPHRSADFPPFCHTLLPPVYLLGLLCRLLYLYHLLSPCLRLSCVPCTLSCWCRTRNSLDLNGLLNDLTTGCYKSKQTSQAWYLTITMHITNLIYLSRAALDPRLADWPMFYSDRDSQHC